MGTPNEQELQQLVDRLSLEDKVTLLTGRDTWSLPAMPAIGLRSIVMSDGPAGVRGPDWDERKPSCSFPSPTAVAASWDRALVHRVGSALGTEAVRKGVDVVLAPTINLHRTPYGGRHFEAFSEDPTLTSELATPYVRGIQQHGVGATVKHYVANDSETDRFTVDVRVDERSLRELYLQAFEGPVVDGPAWLVMSAYNSVNGATATENPLLTTPLQDEWGFTGVVVSDWTAVRSVESARHPQDVVMPGPDGAWGDALVAAVRSGEIDESVVDRKVRRVLLLAARVGALEGVAPQPVEAPLGADEVLEVAREAAGEGMVLLTNDGILPLAAPRRIAVIGEGARAARIQGGGSATVVPASVVSPVEGIRARWPHAEVDWVAGAVVQQGLAPLPEGTFCTPDGEPGLLVRYLDEAGREMSREVRTASWLVWFNGESVASVADTVEFVFRYTPPEQGGSFGMGVGGLADVEVLADGRHVASVENRTLPGDDPASVVLNPPFSALDVPAGGPQVDLVVRFRPVPGEMPDALALRVGTPADDTDPAVLIERAVELAAGADVAVVVVGTSSEVESEGFDRADLALPGAQDALVRAVAAANPRTVVVVNSGAPVTLPWREQVGAVLATWFPGQEFGYALAEVLAGDREPGGRLPVTWPDLESEVPVRDVTPVDGRLVYDEGVHVGYRAWLRAGATPAFPFGHGLGYTAWRTDALDVSPWTQEGVSATVRVTNTGGRAGKHVAQLYLERVSPTRFDRAARWLAGFAVARADAGNSATLHIDVPWRRLATWDEGRWQVEPGEYRLVVAPSAHGDGPVATITVP